MRGSLAVRLAVIALLQLVLLVAVFEVGGVIARRANGGPGPAEVTVYDEDGRLVASTADPPLRADSEHTRTEPARVSGGPGSVVTRGGHPPHGLLLLTAGNTLFGGGLVILVIGSLLTARGIVRPLRELASVARALGEGNLHARTGLRRSDEIGDLARAFDEMGARIEQLLLAEKELLANISHELRTPLARIRVALDIADEADAKSGPGLLAEIGTNLSELETLIDDVFTAARLDIEQGASRAARLELHRERTSSVAMCRSAADRFHARHPTRQLDVVTGELLPTVEVDPVLFRRVLDNLLENAHKYSPDPASSVTLRATANDGGSVVFAVEDLGMGIADEDLPRIFDPFFRADRSRARGTGGVGLGLALAKRIVEAHGGSIEVDSTLDRGTTVQVAVAQLAPDAASASARELEANRTA